jgi:hypothetical protein
MIELLGIPFLLISFFTMTSLPSWLDFKPFNCIVCLSFWCTLFGVLLFIFVPQTQSFLIALGYGGFASYLAMIMKRILIKLY